MTKAQLEKRYSVQIEQRLSTSTWKRTGFVAFDGESEIAQAKTLAELALALENSKST